MVGLAWSNDPESYAGGSVATDRVSHARWVKGDDPDKTGIILIWVIPLCYSKYSDNKHSQTHHGVYIYIYIFCTLCHLF
jgi:hypothetical protein